MWRGSGKNKVSLTKVNSPRLSNHHRIEFFSKSSLIMSEWTMRLQGRIYGEGAPLAHPPPLGFSNTTGILPKKMWFTGVHQSVTPVLSGAPPPKKILDPSLVYLWMVLNTSDIHDISRVPTAVSPEYSRIPWRCDSIFEARNWYYDILGLARSYWIIF